MFDGWSINVGIYIDKIEDDFIDENYFNKEIINKIKHDNKNKKLIPQYIDKRYKDIIEIEPYIYLVQLDNNDLILVSYNNEYLKYDFISININCHHYIKL